METAEATFIGLPAMGHELMIHWFQSAINENKFYSIISEILAFRWQMNRLIRYVMMKLIRSNYS